MSNFLILCNQFIIWSLMRVYLNIFYDTKVLFNSLNIQSNNVLIAANHERKLDPFAILALLPWSEAKKLLPVKFMTASMYYFSILLPFAYLAGCYPTKSKSKRFPAGVEGAVFYLNHGFSSLIFPEGKRTQSIQNNAHSGVVRILQASSETNLLLAHIHWSGRKISIQYELQKYPNYTDASEIMKKIYSLNLNETK